jgi:PAS domain S-box-containing protein
MNGYEVYSILAQNSATSFIPFIFLSAKTEKEDIRVGMQMGADDYITKPFDYDELLKAIELRIAKREKLINATESGFKAMLDSTLTGIIIYQNDKIKFANSKFLKTFGFTKEELAGVDFFEIVDKDYRDDVVNKVRRCIKGIQSSFSITFKAKTKNGDTPNIDCWGGLSTINGQNALIANLININEYRENAEDRNQSSISSHIKEKTDAKFANGEVLGHKKGEIINPDGLTTREIEILQQICMGLTNQEIADKLFLSVRTVDTHRGNILSKTGVSNTAGMVVYAIKHSLFSV